jgi:hypothetical protein
MVSRITTACTISSALSAPMPTPVMTTRWFVSVGLVPLTASLVMNAAYQPSANGVGGINGTSSS